MLSTFSVLDRKHHFLENLVQKIKIASLSWNLVLKLIRICRIQWCCSFFCFRPENHFLSNLVQKIKIAGLSWNLELRLIRICRIQWCYSLFFCFITETPFLINKGKRTRLLSLRPYGSRDFEIGSCRQHGFFILLRCVHPWIVFF